MINKKEIVVPKGINYISDWQDYGFHLTPGRCIIDKQVPGCGFTEFYLRNKENVILASPRIMLLQNKWKQHHVEGGIDLVHFIKNPNDKDPKIDKNIFRETKRKDIPKDIFDRPEPVSEDVYKQIRDSLLDYIGSMNTLNKPYKILVTYDSYHLVKDMLKFEGIFDSFTTMVDEFQVVIDDLRFKATTEQRFIEVLKDVKKVHFVSATPMLDDYLEELEDFKDLDYYIIDWEKEDPSRLISPNFDVRTMRSINTTINPIIEDYKNGKFEVAYRNNPDGSIERIISDEAVFYLNSVNHIINIIKNNKLKPEECNILCSNTPENAKRVKTKLGKAWKIGLPEERGIKPKMFTFCTRTVYLGADFYSTCARTFIFSDANTDCLSVDISQDLPQILGRQRLEENPWKNSARFYYKITADWNGLTKEDFDAIINYKIGQTNDLLRAYDNNLNVLKDKGASEALRANYGDTAAAFNYKHNYVSLSAKGVPVLNMYALVSEKRAFAIQQIDFKDRFRVARKVAEVSKKETDEIVSELLKRYNQITEFTEKLKFACEIWFTSEGDSFIIDAFLGHLHDSDKVKQYYLTVGPEKIKSFAYNTGKIRKFLDIKSFNEKDIEKEILSVFHIGDKITKATAKKTLAEIYTKIGYRATPKATDLGKYFEIRSTQVKENNKWTAGFELLKKTII